MSEQTANRLKFDFKIKLMQKNKSIGELQMQNCKKSERVIQPDI